MENTTGIMTLPTEIIAEVASYLPDEYFVNFMVSNPIYWRSSNQFYSWRLSDQYKIQYYEKKGQYQGNTLSSEAMYKTYTSYSQAKRFFLSQERECFLYITELGSDIAFEYDMFHAAVVNTSLTLFSSVYKRYRQEEGNSDISFQLDTLILRRAVEVRNIPLLFALFDASYNFPLTIETLKIAALSGSLALMQSLFEKYSDKLANNEIIQILQNAALSGDLNLFKWLLEEKYTIPLTNDQIRGIRRSITSIDLLEWFLKKYPVPLDNDDVCAIQLGAIYEENLNLLKWVFAECPTTLTNDQKHKILKGTALDSGSDAFSVDLCKWVFEKYSIQLTEDEILEIQIKAARKGNGDLLKWLMEEKYPISLTNNQIYIILINVTFSGNLNLFKWLLEEKYTISLTNDQIRGIQTEAIYSGNLALVQWVFAEYPTTLTNDQIQLYALQRQTFQVLQWSLERDVDASTINDSYLDRALRYGTVSTWMRLFKKYSAFILANYDIVALAREIPNQYFDTALWFEKKLQLKGLCSHQPYLRLSN